MHPLTHSLTYTRKQTHTHTHTRQGIGREKPDASASSAVVQATVYLTHSLIHIHTHTHTTQGIGRENPDASATSAVVQATVAQEAASAAAGVEGMAAQMESTMTMGMTSGM